MKINSIEFWLKNLELREPYTIAYETVDHCENIFLKIISDSGDVGWGCICPDVYLSGESTSQILENLTHIVKPKLENRDVFELPLILEELKDEIKQARATRCLVDIALYDLICQKLQIPLYKYLGVFRKSIPTSVTIGICSMDETLKKSKQFLELGFFILKLKGGLDLTEDIAKIKHIRERFGYDFMLRFDANQGYSLEQAMDFVTKTEKYKIEIFEQPCDKDSYKVMKKVTTFAQIPVMADESLFNLTDAFRLASDEIIDMINIKLMKVGGIYEANHINSVGRAAGLEAMIGCLDESALGISAGLHFALSKRNIHFADLDGHLDIIDDPFGYLVRIKNGVLYPSESPGLGILPNHKNL